MPLPPDAALSGLPLLLDIEAVRERLNASGAEVEKGAIFYLRYKPETSCIAAYRFERGDRETGAHAPAIYYGKCFTPPAFRQAESKVGTHRWSEPPSGPPIIPFPEAQTLFYAFPNDALLDGLRILEEPKKLQRLLYEHWSSYPADEWRLSDKRLTTELVRYKPERRAVFRSETKAISRQTGEKRKVAVYWRVYGENQGAEVCRRMQFLQKNTPSSGGLTVPAPFGYEPDRQILLMEALPGRPLLEVLQTGEAEAAVENTAAALAALHGLRDDRLPSRGLKDFLAWATETRDMLSFLLPEQKGRVNFFFEKLRKTVPPVKDTARAFVHGDFYYGQVVVRPEIIGLIDFDRSHGGNRLTDLGNFLAHLRLLVFENRLPDVEKLAAIFVNAYAGGGGEKPHAPELRWWTAFALFSLAVEPFRRLEANWPEKVQKVLVWAEEILC